jgi:hypothetical protein
VPAQRFIGATLESVILVGIAALSFLVPATAGASCELTVEPEEATAGSVFHVQGSGFTPTELTLQHEGGKATTFPLTLGTADPFDIPVGSKQSDAGKWHVMASQPGVCSAQATFVATMASTDSVAAAAVTSPHDQRQPPGVYVVVIGLGLVGGALAGRSLLRTLVARRIRP